MIILCCNNTNFDKISISDIANVIIAFANIVLACYIFFYQIRKDKQNEIKQNECSIFRKSFIDILRTVNHEVYIDVKNNIDQLLDHLTRKLLDVGLNLNDKPTFEREIGSRISYSHNDLISKLYNYKGK